jgi:hypothetical protein
MWGKKDKLESTKPGGIRVRPRICWPAGHFQPLCVSPVNLSRQKLSATQTCFPDDENNMPIL